MKLETRNDLPATELIEHADFTDRKQMSREQLRSLVRESRRTRIKSREKELRLIEAETELDHDK